MFSIGTCLGRFRKATGSIQPKVTGSAFSRKVTSRAHYPRYNNNIHGDFPTTRAGAAFWDSDIAWVLSDGPQVAVPIPEDSFAINSSQAAAALGLHPGRFILVPATPELADHAHCGLPSRRVLLAKQTDDSDEEGSREAEPIPYILDLRPVQRLLRLMG